MNDISPEGFKARVLAKFPDAVASDGRRYADIPAIEFTKKVVQKYPDAVTNDGVRYSDFLHTTTPVVDQAQLRGDKPGGSNLFNSLNAASKLPIVGSFIEAGQNLGRLIAAPFTSKEETLNADAKRNLAESADNLILQATKEKDPAKKKYLLDLANRTLRHTEDFNKLNDELKQFETTNSKVAGALGESAVTAATFGPGLAKGLLPRMAEGAALGAGYQASSNLREGNSVTEGLGTASAIGGAIPLAGTLISAASKKVFPWVAEKLEASNLRLTPSQKQKAGSMLDDIVKFGTEHKITGSPKARYQKADALYDATEEKLQNFLSKTEGGLTKKELNDSVSALARDLAGERDVIALKKQLRGLMGAIDALPEKDGIVRWADVNKLKRSTFKNAFNQAGDKIADWLEYKAADAMYAQMAKGLEGRSIGGATLKEFNRRYQLLIKYRALLKVAASRPQMSSGTERLIGAALGLHNIGPIMGAAIGPSVLERVPMTSAKSYIGAGAQKLGEVAKRGAKSNLGRRVFGP